MYDYIRGGCSGVSLVRPYLISCDRAKMLWFQPRLLHQTPGIDCIIMPQSINESLLDKIAEGFFACVFVIRGTECVVKIAKLGASEHHVIEKQIYERLKKHPNLLDYRGEVVIDSITTENNLLGLCFKHEPGETLFDFLKSSHRERTHVEERQWSVQLAA